MAKRFGMHAARKRKEKKPFDLLSLLTGTDIEDSHSSDGDSESRGSNHRLNTKGKESEKSESEESEESSKEEERKEKLKGRPHSKMGSDDRKERKERKERKQQHKSFSSTHLKDANPKTATAFILLKDKRSSVNMRSHLHQLSQTYPVERLTFVEMESLAPPPDLFQSSDTKKQRKAVTDYLEHILKPKLLELDEWIRRLADQHRYIVLPSQSSLIEAFLLNTFDTHRVDLFDSGSSLVSLRLFHGKTLTERYPETFFLSGDTHTASFDSLERSIMRFTDVHSAQSPPVLSRTLSSFNMDANVSTRRRLVFLVESGDAGAEASVTSVKSVLETLHYDTSLRIDIPLFSSSSSSSTHHSSSSVHYSSVGLEKAVLALNDLDGSEERFVVVLCPSSGQAERVGHEWKSIFDKVVSINILTPGKVIAWGLYYSPSSPSSSSSSPSSSSVPSCDIHTGWRPVKSVPCDDLLAAGFPSTWVDRARIENNFELALLDCLKWASRAYDDAFIAQHHVPFNVSGPVPHGPSLALGLPLIIDATHHELISYWLQALVYQGETGLPLLTSLDRDYNVNARITTLL